MSNVFGEIDKSSTLIESNVTNYTHNLTTASSGVQSIKIVSGSINSNYWESLNVLFYTSGSPQYGDEHKFGAPSSNLSIQPTRGEQFLTKYHNYPSSSIIQIPSQYYGEKIKEGSFTFTDLNNPDNSGNNPIIRDDGRGNLYSTNAHHSQSTTAASSSDNYVGNIFYDKGLAVITETGSWSGSVDYSDLATNYTLKSIRNVLSGSSEPVTLGTQYVASTFSSSAWQPYITTINLYQDGDYDTPVIQATLPKPVRKSDKINTRFKIKLDL